MAKQDDGGPAFPGDAGEMFKVNQGMSLREWYEGHALAGLLASDKTEGMSPETVAAYARDYADAMLAHR